MCCVSMRRHAIADGRFAKTKEAGPSSRPTKQAAPTLRCIEPIELPRADRPSHFCRWAFVQCPAQERGSDGRQRVAILPCQSLRARRHGRSAVDAAIAPYDRQKDLRSGARPWRPPDLPLPQAVALQADGVASVSPPVALSAMAGPSGLHITLFRPRVDRARVMDQSRSCFFIQFVREAPDDETPPPNGTRRHFRFGSPPRLPS